MLEKKIVSSFGRNDFFVVGRMRLIPFFYIFAELFSIPKSIKWPNYGRRLSANRLCNS